jgi:hypothetical protein
LWNAAKEQRSNPRSFGKVNGFTQKKELTDIKLSEKNKDGTIN